MLIQIRKIIKLLRLAAASPRALDPHNYYVALEQLFTVATNTFFSYFVNFFLHGRPCLFGRSHKARVHVDLTVFSHLSSSG